MKIFSNFDTEMDRKVFLKKITTYWDWNVILIKRHPLFLYKAFFYWIWALFLFSILSVILYFEYKESPLHFWSFFILHLLGIWIWLITLFSKITSHFWEYREYIKKMKHLDKINFSSFSTFLLYSIILFIYQIWVSLVNVALIFSSNTEMYWAITLTWINLIFLFLISKILYRFIDFEMDFIVVTPDEIESFSQTWFFKRKVVSLDLSKFRSITTEKEWFLRSLFNIWSLVILSEWDREQKGVIRFNFIHRLWGLKKAVLNLVYQNKNKK